MGKWGAFLIGCRCKQVQRQLRAARASIRVAMHLNVDVNTTRCLMLIQLLRKWTLLRHDGRWTELSSRRDFSSPSSWLVVHFLSFLKRPLLFSSYNVLNSAGAFHIWSAASSLAVSTSVFHVIYSFRLGPSENKSGIYYVIGYREVYLTTCLLLKTQEKLFPFLCVCVCRQSHVISPSPFPSVPLLLFRRLKKEGEDNWLFRLNQRRLHRWASLVHFVCK